MSNFAVVVAPLHNELYIEAMHKLTQYQTEGFLVTQRNIIFMENMPHAVYWLERPQNENAVRENV